MKGICFKEPLFHATIEGRKTQTRRIVPECSYYSDEIHVHTGTDDFFIITNPALVLESIKPRYNVGDVVCLKEPYAVEDVGCDTFKLTYQFDKTGEFTRFFTSSNVEEADWDSIHSAQASMKKSRSGFANKLFMPEWAARYFIRITSVRAERLQEISDEDCMKEGIECVPGDIESDTFALRGWDDGYSFPKDAYAYLIDKINGRGTWDSNPWVWVYDYELANLKN